ncbi:POU domain class 6 transcription factor 1-like isoform X1 [Biomphalaria glabrata]|uniref:POU domain protein n=2 Tax=Biomphalaria glabrata TaxID=6526 RepID=A0A2C9K2V7_BIOGL|nr:POU domain, class 6, transcription factor 1-like isoform X1 [Biomphalaria glabrata]KAI8770288.1 POU domain; class 6; transcription factor 1-like isoform X1 [Biomphalaria glabrata]
MDTDSNDGSATDVVDGESKPDLVKLAQSAIIKQDVMLSATSTQSPLAPVSSVFTMPSVSLPHVSMASTGLGLADQLFMSVPSVADTATTPSATESKTDIAGALSSLSSQTHLLGQPQVAPHFFLASQPSASASTGQTSHTVPVQQILIPVSTGNGTQQFISIPVSLATGGNQQIQLITTNNGGQFLATNLSSLQSLTQPLGSNRDAHSISQSSHALANHIASLPQLLTTASGGQLLAVTPQMLASLPIATSQSSSSANAVSLSSHSLSHSAVATAQQVLQHTLSQAVAASVTSKLAQQAHITSSTNGLPPNVSQLLPHTVGNSTESTTVDGINLDEIKEFARQFKIRRLSLGLTQTQVGQALSATEGPAYSQSAICRFEKLDITPKSAQKIKPVLERWMAEAEERYKNGVQNLTDFIGSEPSKKRKRRTSFTPQALELLNQYFERNTHPTGTEMTELSERLNYDREVIRVWFCNKRQALKNTIKKLKQDGQ